MVTFRNLAVTPDDPVAEWTTEGILSAMERGSLRDWRKVAAAVRLDPCGQVAEELEEAIEITESAGTAAVMRRVLAEARAPESDRVARRIRACVQRSGLSQSAFAARIGTSQSRLSTYMSGTVTPSAVVMARIERAGSTFRG